MTFDEMQLILQQIVVTQQEFSTDLVELKALAQSNGRAIQAMLEQAATDRLKREEERAKWEEDRTHHQSRIERLERISEALANISVSIDEDRPTILRKLNAIENKTDAIIERLSRE